MNIRNFSIIAHIDHGKSTLADRLLERTGTITAREMKDQVLDSMELERERGITIKMQPVRMNYSYTGDGKPEPYILNLIDTPGHIDFSYEVSRALEAVEGCLLLVDATQGVQAQTLTTLEMAQSLGRVIVPVMTKIDSPLSRIDDVREEIMELLDVSADSILSVSGKTGEGVELLLEEIVRRIPAPKPFNKTDSPQALVFDFKYSEHKGIVVFVRVTQGAFTRDNSLILLGVQESFNPIEVGILSPKEVKRDSIDAGEIGYIVTGIKKPGVASVGDTITDIKKKAEMLPGYTETKPVVWASIYPESQDDFVPLKTALERLHLEDAAFKFEEETSLVLGRGFRIGFLGMLHMEIITERLRREYDLELIVTLPSIAYTIFRKGIEESEIVYTPIAFPDDGSVVRVLEPWVLVRIIVPADYLSPIMPLVYDHEAEIIDTANFGHGRSEIAMVMPLRELMRGFFDKLKSASSGYASIAYEFAEYREADVVRMDILINNDIVPAFCRIISRRRVEQEARQSVETLKEHMPRQQINIKIQARALGRIIAAESVNAFRKDVTQHMYGGDITRRMKLWEKQKKGKKKMQESGKVNIPHEVFLKMIRNEK